MGQQALEGGSLDRRPDQGEHRQRHGRPPWIRRGWRCPARDEPDRRPFRVRWPAGRCPPEFPWPRTPGHCYVSSSTRGSGIWSQGDQTAGQAAGRRRPERRGGCVGPFRDVPVLHGALVRLEPLSGRHAADLARAAEEDRRAYEFTWVPRGDEVDDYLHSQFQRAVEGKLIPFAQIRMTDQRAVGCTAYGNPRTWPNRPETLRRRDRLDLARRHGAALRDQRRSQAAPAHTCVRRVGSRPGRHQDRCAQREVPSRHRGPRCTLRGRAQELVGVVGSRRRGPVARFRHVFGHRSGMAVV